MINGPKTAQTQQEIQFKILFLKNTLINVQAVKITSVKDWQFHAILLKTRN